ATLRHYQRNEAVTHIPIWRMIATKAEAIRSRANRWATQLQAQGIGARLRKGESTIGGGSLPGETLPTWLLALDADQIKLPLEEVAQRLRVRHIPIVARISRDALLFDPRTVLEEQDEELVQGLVEEV
ncbi:MAG: L-seryl-tRNA(Sec) selenium transferase, partial [Chloroflexota bacterium]|nr:L-seryl-tRNA(Sec) selenium transferase [Chloroflexota bacterium]